MASSLDTPNGYNTKNPEYLNHTMIRGCIVASLQAKNPYRIISLRHHAVRRVIRLNSNENTLFDVTDTTEVVVASGTKQTMPHRIHSLDATWVAVIITGDRTTPKAACNTSIMATL